MQILAQLPYAGTLSPGSVSRKILSQLQAGGAVALDLSQQQQEQQGHQQHHHQQKSMTPREPMRARFDQAVKTQAPATASHDIGAETATPLRTAHSQQQSLQLQRPQRPRAALQSLDPNTLRIGQAALKPVGKSASHRHMRSKNETKVRPLFCDVGANAACLMRSTLICAL